MISFLFVIVSVYCKKDKLAEAFFENSPPKDVNSLVPLVLYIFFESKFKYLN
jgi:hypothetical protein